jgi:CRISPR-associated endonuclease/helicase Cas3
MIVPTGGSRPAVCFDRSYYAHSLPDHPVEHWQRLDVHLHKVAARASQFAQDFQSSDWAWNAGLLHDLGKALDGFQAYLRRENHIDDAEYDETGRERVNHSSAGAAWAEEYFNRENRPFGRVLAYLIVGHHAGLPDYEVCDGKMGALKKRLEEGRGDLESIRATAEAVATAQRPLPTLPTFVKKANFHFWVRMLFSCLVDADYLDTEQFMQPELARHRCGSTTLHILKDALDRHMEHIASKCSDTSVNRSRHDVLKACRVAANHGPGLFTLTVPTGGGKTLSAMTFALDHAIKYGKRRVVYVIPYTSIIEQTGATLATIFGPDNVVEHHSNLDPEKETVRSRMATENWDAPIVITTNVQFFESLYSARPSRCRKLHNLVNSVVILDEAQLVPPNLLAPCVVAINELTQSFGATVVLSTATQPALPNLRAPTEIVHSSLRLYERLKRTQILLPDELETPTTWEELAACLQTHDQVLCIVNSRRDCYDLYQQMPEGTIHLSALMCGEHRSRVIALIKVRLENGEPLRVVSTQLVEAGVDIDFPFVYRALAGLDSIAQAAGRCNREGTLKHEGRVVVFVPPKPAPRGLLHKGECTTKELLALSDFDAHAPESHTRYFDLFYSKINDIGDSILRELAPSDPNVLDVAFRTVGDGFRLIDDGARRPVIVRWGASERLLRQLRYSGPNRILMRRLQRFTVSLHTRVAERMLFDGLLEEVWPGILAQCSLSIYSDATGLDVFREGLPIEDLTGV